MWLSTFIAKLIPTRKVKYTLYYWDYDVKIQDETPMKPSGIVGSIKYEVNVAKNGKHVFATDSTVRNYPESQIRDLILLFREKFPPEEGYTFTITCYQSKAAVVTPLVLTAALDGKFYRTKCDKLVKLQDKLVTNCLDDEYLEDSV